MVPYLGDFAEDATVYIYFNTFTSDDPSASTTITNLADGDIKVYKDGSITQIVTDGATVIINHDTSELGDGVHLLTIDTSAHADYSIGSDYAVRIEGTTVDAGTINAVVGTFSIENRFNAAADDLANGTDGLGALKTLIDAIKTETALIVNDTDVIDDGTSGLVKIATDVAAILVDTGTTIPATISTIDTEVGVIDGVVDTILVDTADMQPRVAAIEIDTETTIPATITTMQSDLDTISNGIITGTAATGTLSTTQCTTNLSGYTDDQLIGRIITFLAGPADGESSDITDYEDTNGRITFTAMTFASENGNAFKIT